LSLFLIGTVFGGLIYLAFKSTFSLVIGVFFSLVSLLIGIFWAINVWKKTGTTQYIGRLHASRDLDDIFTKKKSIKTLPKL
jgi:disulfide bond formation protein DsbB